jgi:hypothetical protein
VIAQAKDCEGTEAIVSYGQICARAALATALLIFAGCLQPAAAGGAQPFGYLSCGTRMDYCLPVCDETAPPGRLLGRCYDRCAVSVSICEASRIPVPGKKTRR